MTVTVVQMRTLVTLLVIQTTGSVIRTTEDVNRLGGGRCWHLMRK